MNFFLCCQFVTSILFFFVNKIDLLLNKLSEWQFYIKIIDSF